MGWQINHNGKTYREGDLTINDAEAIEKLLGATWSEIHPLRSARHAKVVAGFVIAQGEGRDYQEVVAELGTMKTNAFLALVGPEGDDLPDVWEDGVPQTAAAHGTDG
jgi:hypothetical protein